MSKLKFALILPVLQLLLAILLLRWAGPPNFSYPRPLLICLGLNAPAKLFVAVVTSIEVWTGWQPAVVPNIDVVDPFFSSVWPLFGFLSV